MFFFFLLAAFGTSTLNRGENPYKILGVSRGASKSEIRKAFFDITRKYHPDRNKSPEASKIWIRANDAYEILSDDRRRQIYDQTGSVSEDPEPEPQHRYSGGMDPSDIFSQFFFHQTHVEFKTEQIHEDNADDILRDNGECFIYVYSPRSIYPPSVQAFQETSEEFKHITKLCHYNVGSNAALASKYGVTSAPCILYLKLNPDGEITSKIKNTVTSREDFIAFMNKAWNPSIKRFSSAKKAMNWVTKNSEYTRVISFERSNEANMEFKHAASKYSTCKFAVIIDDYVEAIRIFKLTELPCVIAYRGSKKHIIRNLNDLKQLSAPLLTRLYYKNVKSECAKLCFVHINEPQQEERLKYEDFTEAPQFWLPSTSSFVKHLNLTNEKWFALSGKDSSYYPCNYSTRYEVISKYENRRLRMKKIPNNVSVSKSFPETISLMLNSLLKYIMMPVHYLTDSIDFSVIFSVFIILFLFPSLFKLFLGI